VSNDAEREELELIKSGDSYVLKRLYKQYRTSFIQWAQWKYTGVDAADVYQQAFTIFYFNVKDGKFTGMSSGRTYLFAIGKNLLNKLVQAPRKPESIDDIEEINLPADTIFETYEATHRQQMVSSILEKVGEPCKTILTRYYYDNFTMESIAESMGYKTAMVAKKKKCECLTKIRAVLRAKDVQMKEK
jgi:RNA polymerase sigma factor (sigma-70 family)